MAFRFVANGIPILPEEVEEIFRVRIHMTCYSTVYVMGTFPFDSIHELNAICGSIPPWMERIYVGILICFLWKYLVKPTTTSLRAIGECFCDLSEYSVPVKFAYN